MRVVCTWRLFAAASLILLSFLDPQDTSANPPASSTGSGSAQSLGTRRPVVPNPAPGSTATHPIDLFLQPCFAAHRITPGTPVDDRLFARRVSLDIVGLLHTPAELAEFV